MEYKNGLNIDSHGNKLWYYIQNMYNTSLHRIDGPALIMKDDTEFWYLNGKNYSYNNWLKQPEVKSYRIECERLKKLEMI